MKSNYYLIVPNALEESNVVSNSGRDSGVTELSLSYYPLDAINVSGSHLFCSERLYFIIKDSKQFKHFIEAVSEVRTIKNPNWMSHYPQANPEKIFEVIIKGRGFIDAIGLAKRVVTHPTIGEYNSQYLIANHKFVNFLIFNYCPYLMGIEANCNSDLELLKSEIIKNQNKFKLIRSLNDLSFDS